MHKSWLYLSAVVDGYGRKVVLWRLPKTMDVPYCMDAMQEAIAVAHLQYSTPIKSANFQTPRYSNLCEWQEHWRDNVFV